METEIEENSNNGEEDKLDHVKTVANIEEVENGTETEKVATDVQRMPNKVAKLSSNDAEVTNQESKVRSLPPTQASPVAKVDDNNIERINLKEDSGNDNGTSLRGNSGATKKAAENEMLESSNDGGIADGSTSQINLGTESNIPKETDEENDLNKKPAEEDDGNYLHQPLGVDHSSDGKDHAKQCPVNTDQSAMCENNSFKVEDKPHKKSVGVPTNDHTADSNETVIKLPFSDGEAIEKPAHRDGEVKETLLPVDGIDGTDHQESLNSSATIEPPRPTTEETCTDRPSSKSSLVCIRKDSPTLDDDQYIMGTLSSAAESDKDRMDRKAWDTLKSMTSQGEGIKSVSFAQDIKEVKHGHEESIKEGEESSHQDSESGTLFSTAVSEEKILEATRKRRNRPSLADNSTLCNVEAFGSHKRESVSGRTVLSQRSTEHYVAGCSLGHAKNYPAAIVSLDKAINLSSAEVCFYLMRGDMYMQLTDFQSAIQNYKKACVLHPKSDLYYSKLAFVYYLQGQSLFDQCLFTEALESFSRAAEMRPGVIGYHTRSIACLSALERHGECLALVNTRLEVDQSNPDLYIMRARLHLLFRNTSLCYYDLKDALSLNPDQPEARKLLQDLEKRAEDNRDHAIRLQLQGKLNEALQKITIAIEINPTVAEFHLLRGAVHRRLHDFNSAIDDFLLALDKTEHDEGDRIYMDGQRQLLLTYNDFAVDCFLGNHFEEAILLLNKAIKGEKNEKGLYINRGDCFYRLNDLHFALADYHQALELDCQDWLVRRRIAAIHNQFGVIDYEEQSYQDADARYSIAIQHDPKQNQYYLNRAKVRFMLENHHGARQDILTSLHLNPGNNAIHSLLARLFPGKSVADVLRSKAAREAKHILDNAVVTASPIKLPSISKLTGSKYVKSFSDSENRSTNEDNNSPFVLFMNGEDFNKVLTRSKSTVAVNMKHTLEDGKTFKRDGPHLLPQPPPRNFEYKGGHWKKFDTPSPPGWRTYSLGIAMKDS